MSLIVESFSPLKEFSAAQSAVLRTLIYFAIFKHPLSRHEIFNLLQDKSIREEDAAKAIDELSSKGLIQNQDGYYFPSDDSSALQKRMQREEKAEQSFDRAKKFSTLIASFPFVRAVSLSGSLSKKSMDENSDIDYFIITTPGRMWLARTLLVLYKKIFLFNSRQNFCINYFVTEDTLEIPDKNIFTATEVSFLIPTYNYDLYLRFMNANGWIKNFLPNFPTRQPEIVVEKKFFFKPLIEKILMGKAGSRLDSFFFDLTLKYRKRKFRQFDESTFGLRMRSQKNISKHHPLGFQEKVLLSYSENISSFVRTSKKSLHAEGPAYA